MRSLLATSFLFLSGCAGIAPKIFPPEMIEAYNRPPNARTAQEVADRTPASGGFLLREGEWQLSTKSATYGALEGVYSTTTTLSESDHFAMVNHFRSYKTADAHTIRIMNSISYYDYEWRMYSQVVGDSISRRMIQPDRRVAYCNGRKCLFVETYSLEFKVSELREMLGTQTEVCWEVIPMLIAKPERICFPVFELRGLLLALDRELAKA